MDPIGGPGAVAARAARALGMIMGPGGGGSSPFTEEASGGGFADTLKRMIGEVVELQDESNEAIAAFVRGEPVELHQVMAAVEEAGIALDLLIEIRNRLTEAYRTVIQMQN